MSKSTVDPKEMKSLEQLRDELKVQAHLFKAEAKKEWERLEKDLRKLRLQAVPVERAARQSADDIRVASRLLLKSLKKGYERIRESLAA